MFIHFPYSYWVVHPTYSNWFITLVISGRLAPTYPINKTRVSSPTYDSWDEPPSTGMPNHQLVVFFVPLFSNAAGSPPLKPGLNCCFGRTVPLAIFLHQDLERWQGTQLTADINSSMFLRKKKKKTTKNNWIHFQISSWVLAFQGPWSFCSARVWVMPSRTASFFSWLPINSLEEIASLPFLQGGADN